MSSSSGDTQGYLGSRAYSWYVFALLFLLYMFDYIDRMVVVSLFPFIKAEWGVTDTQCGMLVSAVSWSIVLFTFPVSVLIDRWSRKKCIGLMAVVWSLATATCAFTRNFWQLFTARAFIGVGEAGYAPGGTAMIAALFPEDKRAKVMGIWNSSIPLGAALGIAIGGIVADRFGWRHAFGLVAFPGLIVAILFFWVRDYKSVSLVKSVADQTTQAAQERMSLVDIVKEFTRSPSLMLTYLGFAGNTFATAALLAWLPTFFYRVDDLSMSQAGVKSGAIMLLAIIGSPLGGYLADTWMKRRINARLLFVALSSLITFILFFIAFSMPYDALRYPILLIAGVSAAMFVPGAAAVTQDVVHPGLRAISYSLCVIVQQILGTALGPIFVGAMSDAYGIAFALRLLPISYLVAAVLFLAGSFFYEQDRAKVEKVALVLED